MTEHPTSPLAALKAARGRRVQERTITLGIPDTDVFVKYRAAEQKELAKLSTPVQKAEKTGSNEKVAAANVRFSKALLGVTCLGIYQRGEDGELVSIDPEGEAPVFDGRLCELLEEPVLDSASDIVGLLYSDLDVLMVQQKVLEFSAGGEIETLEDLPGN